MMTRILPSLAGALALAACAMLAPAHSLAQDATTATAPVQPRIVTKADWGGGPATTTLMKAHTPIRFTLHHEGSPRPLGPDDDEPKRLRGLQLFGWNAKNWGDVPYHYLIGYHGTIYEGRDVNYAGDTNTSYDPSGHLLVMLLGNCEEQVPTRAQLEAMIGMLAHLSRKHGIDPDTITGHKDHTPTACPGRYFYPYITSGFIRDEVKKRLAAMESAGE